MHNLTPYHEVRDAAKVETIAESMMQNGWIGAPIVTDGEYQALTGAHRLAAVSVVNGRYETFESDRKIDEIPTIDIRDIWAEAGMAESIDAYLTYEACDEYITIVGMLPTAICEEYGLDIH